MGLSMTATCLHRAGLACLTDPQQDADAFSVAVSDAALAGAISYGMGTLESHGIPREIENRFYSRLKSSELIRDFTQNFGLKSSEVNPTQPNDSPPLEPI